MIRIDIRPVWTFRGEEIREFDFGVIALLEGVERTGKLTRAAEHAGFSYRHAWNLLERWGAFFGTPLVTREKGRGSTLTQLGSHLLWAGKRAQARLEPELQNLASEFATALNDALFEARERLDIHASHDFAVAALVGMLGGSALAIDTQYTGSFDAIARLKRRECELAGFHLPLGRIGAPMARRYKESLPAGVALLGFVTRNQGLIVRAGNPKAIHAIDDLARRDVRMINRQRGSGTRSLLELLLDEGAIDRARVRGYENEESTHSAVAALIAGNQADVGLGTEAAARQFGLAFEPLCRERYMFACHESALDTPAVESFRKAMRGAPFAEAVARLAGYLPDSPGEILPFAQAFAPETRLTETP
jgi:molybdate transport repressor ModE-like protein